MNSVAKRYAEGLLLLAIEQNDVLSYQKNIQHISLIIQKNKENSSKKDFFKSIVEVSKPEIFNFIYLLIVKNRLNYLDAIINEFNDLCNNHLGIKQGIVYSVVKLSAKQINEIEKSLSHRMKARVILENEIDTRLLGGLKVAVDDMIFDNSIHQKIQAMHKDLLNKEDVSNYGN